MTERFASGRQSRLSDDEFTSVSIPTRLVRKIEVMIKGTSFASVSSYVGHVLEEAVSETRTAKDAKSFTKEEEEAVKDRLRALGYLG